VCGNEWKDNNDEPMWEDSKGWDFNDPYLTICDGECEKEAGNKAFREDVTSTLNTLTSKIQNIEDKLNHLFGFFTLYFDGQK